MYTSVKRMNRRYLWTSIFIAVISLRQITAYLHHFSPHHYEVIDLLRNIDWNATEGGLLPTRGLHTYSVAYLFEGIKRNVHTVPHTLKRAQRLLENSHDFTFLATVKQEKGNSGSLISFSSGYTRLLELQSSGRRNEIRLHYTHHHHSYVETFPFVLADTRWHQVALTISDRQTELYLDCKKIFERLIRPISTNFFDDTVKLWIGQRGKGHSIFKGTLQDVKLVVGPHGHIEQCPSADSECPTCGQFRQLERQLQRLQTQVELLTDKLETAENKIGQLQQCDCVKSCHANGTVYRDGELWKKDGCTYCACRDGKVECAAKTCPPLKCKNPILSSGRCCPECLKHCFFLGKPYDHGDGFSPKPCIDCVCENGDMTCTRRDVKKKPCPKLECRPNDQILVPGQCCRICKDTNHCYAGHECHPNATCVSFLTKYACKCNPGFQGNGRHCTDVDECQIQGGIRGNHCHGPTTTCVNTVGSYSCQCIPGYKRVDEHKCTENNECKSGEHSCHSNATCINTIGSYKCECLPGFKGDGFNCQPVCEPRCKNGGVCTAPNTCVCKVGYYGKQCELDFDECSTGTAQCQNTSVCINVPGWYFCQCKPGYHGDWKDGRYGENCEDVNECRGEGGGHTCHPSTICVNTPGGYECTCAENRVSKCYHSCVFEGIEYADGSEWKAQHQKCSRCHCKEGVMTCDKVQCDCLHDYKDYECCPHCSRQIECQDPNTNKTHQSGDTWINKCEICECIKGEIDCWNTECPTLSCDSEMRFHEEGECCPKCITEDPCNIEYDKATIQNSICTHKGKKHYGGDTWILDLDPCVYCQCKAGHTCCTFNQTCMEFSFDAAVIETNIETKSNDTDIHGNVTVSKETHHDNKSRNLNKTIDVNSTLEKSGEEETVKLRSSSESESEVLNFKDSTENQTTLAISDNEKVLSKSNDTIPTITYKVSNATFPSNTTNSNSTKMSKETETEKGNE